MTRPYYIVAGVAIAGLLLIGLNWPRVSNTITMSFNQPTPITVGLKWVHQGQFAGYYVAEQKGWYKDKNLKVTLTEHHSDSNTATEVAEGKLTFGIVNSQSVLQTYAETENIIAVAAIYQTSPSLLVARSDSKITKPSDLRGKVLGIESSDSNEQQVLYEHLLRNGKVPINSITFREVGHDQVGAIMNKTIDAALVYRTQETYQLKQLDPNFTSIKPEDYGVVDYNDVLIVNKQWLENHPQAAQDFITATLEGWRYTLAHPQEAAEITLPYTNGTLHNLAYQQSIIENSIPLITPLPGQPLGAMTIKRWQEVYDQLRQNLMIPSFDLNQLFTNGYNKS